MKAAAKLEAQMSMVEAYRRTLQAAMEVMDHPAYLLSPGGIEHANRAGRARLEREGDTAADILRAGASGGKCFTVAQPGLPPLQLVTLTPSSRCRSAALQRAIARFCLSPRQAQVLAQLAEGDTNKSIAAKLGCAEVTIEFHLRRLFGKTGAQNRSELIALFWK